MDEKDLKDELICAIIELTIEERALLLGLLKDSTEVVL